MIIALMFTVTFLLYVNAIFEFVNIFELDSPQLLLHTMRNKRYNKIYIYICVCVCVCVCVYMYVYMVGWLFGFYGISTFVGYLMPNPFLCKKSVLFQTIQFSNEYTISLSKTFLFQVIQLRQTTLI